MLLLIYFVAQLVLVACMALCGRYDRPGRPEYVCAILILGPTLFLAVQIGLPRLSPRAAVAPRVSARAHALLDCLIDVVPSTVDVDGVKQCVATANVYNVSKSRIPYVSSSIMPTAFVVPRVFGNSLFVVGDLFDKLGLSGKALLLIHECTHIALDTYDYAYRWQKAFDTLTPEEHARNADSYVDAVDKYCVNRIEPFY